MHIASLLNHSLGVKMLILAGEVAHQLMCLPGKKEYQNCGAFTHANARDM